MKKQAFVQVRIESELSPFISVAFKNKNLSQEVRNYIFQKVSGAEFTEEEIREIKEQLALVLFKIKIDKDKEIAHYVFSNTNAKNFEINVENDNIDEQYELYLQKIKTYGGIENIE